MYEDFRSVKLCQILAPIFNHYYGVNNWSYCGIIECNFTLLHRNTHRFRIHTDRCQANNVSEIFNNNSTIISDITNHISLVFPNTEWYHKCGSDYMGGIGFNNPTQHSTYIDLCFNTSPHVDMRSMEDMLIDDSELTRLFDQLNLHQIPNSTFLPKTSSYLPKPSYQNRSYLYQQPSLQNQDMLCD
jgi:hypothetical protein